jgi:hypothetical protein
VIQNLLASALMLLPLQLPDVQAQVAETMEAAKTKETPVEVAPSPEPLPPAPKPVQATTAPRRVSSTAYCLTGTMANGQRAHYGAVAMNGVPFGTRVAILSGPRAGTTVVVKDRIGHSSGFDLAYPGNCSAAIQYGRRNILISVL